MRSIWRTDCESDHDRLRTIIFSGLVPTCLTSIYCWGSGIGAQGFQKIEHKPIELRLKKNRVEFNVISVSAGNRVSSFVTDTGRVYSWGESLLCRSSASHKERSIPGEIHLSPERAAGARVAYGENYGYILSHDGNLYEFGDPPTESNVSRSKRRVQCPKQKRYPLKISDVACGQSSAIILKSDRTIDMFGYIGGVVPRTNETKNTQICPDPEKFMFTESIESIACGLNHCVVASSNGRCYVWGLAERLGLGPGLKGIINEPRVIDYFLKRNIEISLVACGATHSCVVTSDKNRLFCFGDNTHLQCGPSENSSKDDGNLFYPREIIIQGLSIFSLSCGFAHSAFVTKSGKLFTWGFNDEGQLGLEHENAVGIPTMVSFDNGTDGILHVVTVACGRTHTISILSDLTPSKFHERKETLSSILKSSGILCRFFRCIKRPTTKIGITREEEKPNIIVEETPPICTMQQLNVSDYISSSSSSIDSESEVEVQSINESPPMDERDAHYQTLIERVDMDREDKRSKAVELAFVGDTKVIGVVALTNSRQVHTAYMNSNVNLHGNICAHSSRGRRIPINSKIPKSKMSKLDEQIRKAADRLLTYRSKKARERDELLKPMSALKHKKYDDCDRENRRMRQTCNHQIVSTSSPIASKSKQLLDRRKLRLAREMNIQRDINDINGQITELLQERSALETLSVVRLFQEQLHQKEKIFTETVHQHQLRLDEIKRRLDFNTTLTNTSFVTSARRFKTVSEWTGRLEK